MCLSVKSMRKTIAGPVLLGHKKGSHSHMFLSVHLFVGLYSRDQGREVIITSEISDLVHITH